MTSFIKKIIMLLWVIFSLPGCSGNTVSSESDGSITVDSVVLEPIVNPSNPLSTIQLLIDDAATGKQTDVIYITAGDSKRDSYHAGQRIIYPEELSRFNIDYSHQAISGVRAESWVTKPSGSRGLLGTVENATGVDGETTIIEYSLGANDYNAAVSAGSTDVYSDIYLHIKFGITELQKLLPKAKIFLVEPTGSERVELQQVYADLAVELNLHLIDSVMDVKRDDEVQQVKFQYDTIHPNTFGAKRNTRNILSRIVSATTLSNTTWDTSLYTDTSAFNDINLVDGVTIDHSIRLFETYNSTSNSNYRSIHIPVVGGSLLKVSHTGNYLTTMPLGPDGNGVLSTLGYNGQSRMDIGKLRKVTDLSGVDYEYMYLYVPKSATSIVINLSNEGATFDNTNAVTPMIVEYASTSDLNKHPSTDELHSDLNIENVGEFIKQL